MNFVSKTLMARVKLFVYTVECLYTWCNSFCAMTWTYIIHSMPRIHHCLLLWIVSGTQGLFVKVAEYKPLCCNLLWCHKFTESTTAFVSNYFHITKKFFELLLFNTPIAYLHMNTCYLAFQSIYTVVLCLWSILHGQVQSLIHFVSIIHVAHLIWNMFN